MSLEGKQKDNGKTLTPQTLLAQFGVIFCIQKTNLGLRTENSVTLTHVASSCVAPVSAIKPLIPIEKEIERSSQEGEDISVLDNVGPVRYHPRKTANTRPADAALIMRASRFSKKLLRRESGASQHAIHRFFRGERIYPGTRKKPAECIETLEKDISH